VGCLAGVRVRPARHDADALLVASGLVLVSRYGEFRYGIPAESIAAVRRSGRQPLITVSPDAAARLARDAAGWRGAFIDARNDVLDSRLAAAFVGRFAATGSP
jgi:hypothetical protein